MLNTKNKNKGQVLVLVALSLVVFIGFAALAIDVAYFYHTRHQLQGAADAAALAGAAMLTGDRDTDDSFLAQKDARQEAWKFACKNKAAGLKVYLNTNVDPSNCEIPPSYTNLNGSDNVAEGDIVVGNWDSTKSPPFTRANGETKLLINAVKIVARRTEENSDTGRQKVDTFFGKIFGVNKVSIRAEAISSRPAKGTVNLSYCFKACTSVGRWPNFTNFTTPRQMKIGTQNSSPVVPDNQQMAWTNIGNQPDTNTNDLRDAICGGPSTKDVCDEPLYSTMSNPSPLMASLKSVFLDYAYDAGDDTKPFVNVTALDRPNGGKKQTVWWVVIPIVDRCAATEQGAENDPKNVVRYAKARIIGVCPKSSTPPQPLCKPFPSLPLTRDGQIDYINKICDDPKYDESVVIDRISCIECGNRSQLLGTTTSLVE